jgi:hypothetical protein
LAFIGGGANAKRVARVRAPFCISDKKQAFLKIKQIMHKTELFVTGQGIEDYFVYYQYSVTNLGLHRPLGKTFNKTEGSFVQRKNR